LTKINIISNFFVIIGHYRYPLQAYSLIVAVIYHLSNYRDPSAVDARAVNDFTTVIKYGN